MSQQDNSAKKDLHERAKQVVLDICLEESARLKQGADRRKANYERLGLEIPSSIEVTLRASLILMGFASTLAGFDILEHFEDASRRDEAALVPEGGDD